MQHVRVARRAWRLLLDRARNDLATCSEAMMQNNQIDAYDEDQVELFLLSNPYQDWELALRRCTDLLSARLYLDDGARPIKRKKRDIVEEMHTKLLPIDFFGRGDVHITLSVKDADFSAVVWTGVAFLHAWVLRTVLRAALEVHDWRKCKRLTGRAFERARRISTQVPMQKRVVLCARPMHRCRLSTCCPWPGKT